jgi:hypothetical protein
MTKKIVLISSNITEPQKVFLNNISIGIKKLADFEVSIYDPSVYEYDIKDPCILFGNCKYVIEKWDDTILSFQFPSIKELMESEEARKNTKEKLKKIVLDLSEDKEEVEKYIETPSGVTVGPLGCDVLITEHEATYLKNILDILGGGKIIITKGDLKIEVER